MPESLSLYTVHGNAVFFDPASGALRHSADPPVNVALRLERNDSPIGRLVAQAAGLAGPGQSTDGTGAAATEELPEEVEVVPLERGLVALRQNNHFLRAVPGGACDWLPTRVNTWEVFLLSDRLPGRLSAARRDDEIDHHAIRQIIVDPYVRARVTSNDTRSLRVLIFGHRSWSHGRVYYDLCRHLYPHGFTLDLLNWREIHDQRFTELACYYDLFLAALDGIAVLIDRYGVPPRHIVAVSHSERDMEALIERKGRGIFDRFAGYAVVSECLFERSAMLGITRQPTVAGLGVDAATFRMTLPERCEVVGYAGSMALSLGDVEVKRGHLAEAAVRAAGLEWRVAASSSNQISIHDMPAFYSGVDAVVVSSLNESVGLPSMEAAVAGRLVIGTPVGDFAQRAATGAGLLAPLQPDRYRGFVVETLQRFQRDPVAFRAQCEAIQTAAERLDWSYRIGDWAALLRQSARAAGIIRSSFLDGETCLKRNPTAIGAIHVINLDRDTERLATFRDANAHLADRLVRVPAVCGAEVDRAALERQGDILPDLRYGNGSLGSALSHISLWRQAVATGESVTVCEDDIVFARSFAVESTRLVRAAPDGWDVIYWAILAGPLFQWIDLTVSRARLEFYAHKAIPQAVADLETASHRGLVKLVHSFGLLAYTVSPGGAARLLDIVLPLRHRYLPFPDTGVRLEDTSIDCPVAAAQLNLSCFAVQPPLALHADGGASTRAAADAPVSSMAGRQSDTPMQDSEKIASQREYAQTPQ